MATFPYVAKTLGTTWASMALAGVIAYLATPLFGYTLLFVTLPVAIAFGVVMDRRYDRNRPYVELPK